MSLVVEDLSASARGPPIEVTTWFVIFVPHPAAAQLLVLPLGIGAGTGSGSSSAILFPVDNFNDTSDAGEFPGIETERQVKEFIELPAFILSDSSTDRGQSSKKCHRMWPSDLLPTSFGGGGPIKPLLSVLELQ
jgi:hypothetical protein